ncbi:MAG TPA: DUF6624 domain-containing protein, partial [Holophagaceae bacterium]|nr:DUF6624 domain-containing protein [Holophagaceae bacterium]
MVAATPEQPNALSDGMSAARVVRSDAQGRFQLKDLPAGAYGATATAPGFSGAFLGHLAVPATGALKDISFILPKGGTTFEGRVVLPGANPPAGVQVFALRESQDAGDIFYAQVDGAHYRLTLGDGSYTLVASGHGLEGPRKPQFAPTVTPSWDLHLFPEKGSDPALASELVAMAHADQDVRNRNIQHPDDKAIQMEWLEVDKKNEARLQEIVKAKGWPTAALVGPKAENAAWLLAQHASAPFLKRCLPDMKAAAERGELDGGLVALSIDRDLIHDGKKQIYGSQFSKNGKGEWAPDPIEDEAHVDERRATLGLEPMAQHAARINRMYAPVAK